jgi:phosphoribosyl transferase-like protein/phosphoribosyltransferase-like predicted ribonucleoside biosynthesis protein
MRTDTAWSGRWTADRLGIRVVEGASGPFRIAELAGLAVRRNPNRAHLVVSQVLGKHVPVEPRRAVAAGRFLAARVADALGEDVTTPLVLGFAETATALGHLVADVFPDAAYLHSTRRPPPSGGPLCRFEEAHSHAVEHMLQPEAPDWFDRDSPLILVDDELTTGRTAVATIRALHRSYPRSRYVVATLLDLRGETDREDLADTARKLGTRIDVVALAGGRLETPPDVLQRGRRLCEDWKHSDRRAGAGGTPVRRLTAPWPADLPEGGRHGFEGYHRPAYNRAVAEVAHDIHATGRVLVLGTEELMYLPLRLADELSRRPETDVRFSSTTRSPVLPRDDPGYAIRSRLTFTPHDLEQPDGTARFAYNVATGEFDHIILVVDDRADTTDLWRPGGLVAALRGLGGGITVVVVPAYRPALIPEAVR